jgi:hypothetical protein
MDSSAICRVAPVRMHVASAESSCSFEKRLRKLHQESVKSSIARDGFEPSIYGL